MVLVMVISASISGSEGGHMAVVLCWSRPELGPGALLWSELEGKR